MSYPESVRYLYSLGNEMKAGAKLGLERMRILVDALGNPEKHLKFIHIAGTNGKGSTSSMVAGVLSETGRRIGLFTSPHLISPVERIQINGHPVGADQFAEAFDTVHRVAETLLQQDRIDAHPSYFETVTGMALLLFRVHCEMVVWETGLGGRLDATNIVDPNICGITSIAFDHEAFLGTTIEAIAGEKAGIVKPGVPVVVGRQPFQEAQSVIVQRGRELGSPVIMADQLPVSHIQASPEGSSFSIEGLPYECPLAGRHQIDNAITAIAICRELGIASDLIRAGLKKTSWPGRLEYVSREPTFILDGAHNSAGASVLRSYIEEFYAGRLIWIVYGAMRDKAIEEVTTQLFPLAQQLILTAPSLPRALRPEAILEITPHSHAAIAASIPDAIEIVRSAPRDAVVFFTGSLFLVGEVRAALLGHGDAS